MAQHTQRPAHLLRRRCCPSNSLVREHIRAGGRAVALEAGVNGQMITLYDKGTHMPLLWTHLIPATLEGMAKHNVQNAMFAAAMALRHGREARRHPPRACAPSTPPSSRRPVG
jgi:hypothetical protein